MRASLIFDFARTIRCARVGDGVRKACATSSVVRPQTSRSVSAIWASGLRAGWQQVKMSRKRSSSTPSSYSGISDSASRRFSADVSADSIFAVLQLRAGTLDDRSNLNRARPGGRNTRRHLNGVVQIPRLDQVVATELFLRLGERAIGGRDFSVARAHRGGGLGGLKLIRPHEFAALLDALSKCSVLSHVLVLHVLGEFLPLRLVVVNQAKVLHRSSRLG